MLVQRVLPLPKIKERLSPFAVGLASDCDEPVSAVASLMRNNLPDATLLPFVGVLSWDGKWIDGYSGPTDEAELLAFIDRVREKAELDASAKSREALAKLAKKIDRATMRKDWKAVLGFASQLAVYPGRCPERDAIQAAAKTARDWAEAAFDAMIADASTGAGLGSIRKQLTTIERKFAGHPEAKDAGAGLRAIKELGRIRGAEARGKPKKDPRAEAQTKWKGTRWVAIFATPTDSPEGSGQKK